jgi:IclR family transcriptional regulator, acetate operon repressor
MARRKIVAERVDFLSTVERAMRVLEYLADEQDGLSVSELARRLEINKSIVLRILTTMEQLAYIYRDRDSQRYRLTYRMANLTLRQLARSGLVDQCVPVLRRLAERTGELVRLAVIESERPVWIQAISGPQRQLRIDPVYSHEVVLHSHATGKAWLMTLDEKGLDRLLAKHAFKAYTKYTITTARALKSDLKAASKRGFATSYEEHELGVSTVAAPILVEDIDGRRQCVGVISLAAPASRLDRAALTQCGDLVIEAANQLASVWPLLLSSRPARRLPALRAG